MEAVIPGKNLLVFSKMIVCLSKIGEDLFIEAMDSKLVFRTLNQTRSAFFCFAYHRPFFERYNLQQGHSNYRCKILLKSCLAVFKNNNNVDKCFMAVKAEEESFLFDMYCKHGVKKTYRLDVEECEPLQAIYSKDQFPNKLVIQAQLLNLSLMNFPSGLTEITLVLEKDHVRVKSYTDNVVKTDDLMKKILMTELVLNPADFENYEFKVSHRVELTFCLKEMKAILGFCDKQNQTISMWMDTEGKPIVMSIVIPRALDADFVLTTLQDLDPDVSQSASQTPRSSNSQSKQANSGQDRDTKSGVMSSSISRSSPVSQASSPPPSPNLHTPPLSYSALKRTAPPDIPPSPTPNHKRARVIEEEYGSDEEDLLWDKDMLSNVIQDNEEDSDDVPDSQEK